MAYEYDYAPLDNRCDIRLLKLYPGSLDDPIHACLRRISLNSATDTYKAISYVWGSPFKCEAVNTSRGTIFVTRSLHRILRRLRRPHQTRLLWADAVCINQNDNAEKSRQIRMMRDIYRNASCTLVCLTEDISPKRSLLFFCMYPAISLTLTGANVVAGKRPIMPKPLLVKATLEQNWLTRVWVVQEYIASKKCRLILNTHEWDADYFEFITLLIYITRFCVDLVIRTAAITFSALMLIICLAVASYFPPDLGFPWSPKWWHIVPLEVWGLIQALLVTDSFVNESVNDYRIQRAQGFWELFAMRRPRTNLLNLLETLQAHPRQCERARDHLFALLGISLEANGKAFYPDYIEPFDKIVLRYARGLLDIGLIFPLLHRASVVPLSSRYSSAPIFPLFLGNDS